MEFHVGDTTYVYHTYGQGTPLVLLHGFTGSTSTWDYFISKWKKNHQLITIDLLGHGKTKSTTKKTMKEVCIDLNNLFEHIGLSSFHLLGYSMGGRIALSYAMFYPDQLLSLILESASPGLETIEERKNRVEADEKLAQKLEKEGIESFVSFWESISLFSSQKRLSESIQQTIRDQRLSQSAGGLALSLRSIGTGSQPSWWENLSSVKIPVLLIVGELDEKYVLINKNMHERLPYAKIIIIKNTGHAIHVEEKEKFGRIVLDFIEKVNNKEDINDSKVGKGKRI